MGGFNDSGREGPKVYYYQYYYKDSGTALTTSLVNEQLFSDPSLKLIHTNASSSDK